MIKLENIYKIFQLGDKQLTALDNVSLDIPKGKIVGVIGASGAGKSTLIRCVNLLERPTSGNVFVDGQNLMQLTPAQLVLARRQIGMIFQHFNTPKEQIQNKVNSLLDMVGLSDKKEMYPSNLSGGQKQRVAIARALANDPKVLLCDEATSALDPATTQSILKLLKEINRNLGITILLITHEMDVVKQICDHVAIIDKGTLVEQGSVSEIFSNPKTQLAQDFIHSTFHINLPDEYLAQLSDSPRSPESYPLIKFEFTGRSVDAPLLSLASKKFGIDLAEVEGDEDAITQAKIYLIEHNVRVEVLGYV